MADRLEYLPLWDEIGTVSLEEMDSVRLMNRIDTKFVTTEGSLPALLEKLSALGYKALVTCGRHVAEYDTLYYDTPLLKMFNDHQRGKLTRQKVRTRIYVNSGTAFLEVKRKNNHGRTKKKRVGISGDAFSDFSSDAAASAFLKEKSGYAPSDLRPVLESRFTRITLVNPGRTERLTIDYGLSFRNVATGTDADLGNASVIELKRDSLAPSPALRVLLELRIHPLRISKYCIGTARTNPEVRSFRFREKLRYLDKIKNL